MKKEEEQLRSVQAIYRAAAKMNLYATARCEARRALSPQQLDALLQATEAECQTLHRLLGWVGGEREHGAPEHEPLT